MNINDVQNPYIQSTNYDNFKISIRTTDDYPIFESIIEEALPELEYGTIKPIEI